MEHSWERLRHCRRVHGECVSPVALVLLRVGPNRPYFRLRLLYSGPLRQRDHHDQNVGILVGILEA